MALTGKNISLPIYHDVNGVRTPFHNLVLHKFTVDSVVMSLGDKITGDVYYIDSNLECSMKEYVVFNDVEYTLVNPPTLVREGLVKDNSDLNGMSKFSFEFYHPMYILGNLPFTDVAVSYDEMRYKSQDKTFSWIGKPADFVAKLNKNLEGTEWVVVLSDRFPQDKEDELSEVLSFDNSTIADVLKTGYETWGVPFVVDKLHQGEYYHTDANNNNVDYYTQGKRFVVVFGLPSNEIYASATDEQQNIPFVFRFGQGVGLKNNSRTPRNNKIVTRIAGYGSENNIPYGYPQIRWYGDPNATCTIGDSVGAKQNVTINGTTYEWAMSYPIYDGIVGGEWVKLIKHPFTRNHLMPTIYTDGVFDKVSQFLPNGSANPNYNPDIEIKDYYDAVEGEEGYDYKNLINPVAPSYEIHEFDDIKPELGEAYILGATPINADLTDADGWDDTMDDNGNYLQSYFKITLPQLTFDIYACAAITQEMEINMRSGACIGCTFTVQVDWEDYKRNFYDSDMNFAPNGQQRDYTRYPDSSQGSITVVVQKDINTFGTLMPNIYQNPHAGDAFVVLGISLPLSYITSAQERLDDAMKSYMLGNNVYYFDYPLKFDEYMLANNTHILNQIRPNTIIRFDFNDEPLELFVKQLTIKFNESTLPQYDITLTDNIEVVLNQIGQVAEDVERLGTLIALLRQNYNKNAWAELAKKLSKVNDDTAAGLISFAQGWQTVGFFSNNFLGYGANVNQRGVGEFEELNVRGALRASELVFNRISAEEGESIRSIGHGEILTVEPDTDENDDVLDTGVATLKLEGDEWATIETEDICRGLYNTINKAYDNAQADGFDDNGFRLKAGFFASYFEITSITSSKGSCTFAYRLQSGTTEHPCPFMKFAVYGNFNRQNLDAKKKRQSSIYTTAIGISPRELYLAGVNDWVIKPENIKIAKGNIQGIRAWEIVSESEYEDDSSGNWKTETRNGETIYMHLKELHGDAGFYCEDNIYLGGIIDQFKSAAMEIIEAETSNLGQAYVWTDKSSFIVDCDSNGTVLDDVPLEFTAKLYYGSELCTLTNVTINNVQKSIQQGATSYSYASYVPIETLEYKSNVISISLTGTHNSTTYTATKSITVFANKQGQSGDTGGSSAWIDCVPNAISVDCYPDGKVATALQATVTASLFVGANKIASPTTKTLELINGGSYSLTIPQPSVSNGIVTWSNINFNDTTHVLPNSAYLKITMSNGTYTATKSVSIIPTLRGEQGESVGGYSAQLTHSSDSIAIDAQGNVVGGLNGRLYTSVNIWDAKNGYALGYQRNVTENDVGKYTVVVTSADGCTASVSGGTIRISSAADSYDTSLNVWRVNITATTYDDVEFKFIYSVTLNHLDESYLTFDLDNEYDSMAYRTQINRYDGLPISSTVKVYANDVQHIVDGNTYGNVRILNDVSVGYINKTTVTSDLFSGSMISTPLFSYNLDGSIRALSHQNQSRAIQSNSANTGLVLDVNSGGTITLRHSSLSGDEVDLTDAKHWFDIDLEVVYGGVTYISPTKRLTIGEETDSTIYRLMLSATAISQEETTYTPSSIDVKASITDNNGTKVYSVVNDVLKDENNVAFTNSNIKIRYINGTYNMGGSNELSTTCPLFSQVQKVFTVVLVDLTNNNNPTYLDIQTVTINKGGKDGAGQSWINASHDQFVVDCAYDGTISATKDLYLTANLRWGDEDCVITSATIGTSNLANVTVYNTTGVNTTQVSKRITFVQGRSLSSSYITITLVGKVNGVGDEHTAQKTVSIIANKAGQNGVGIMGDFKSTAFIRTNLDLDDTTPIGGDYDSPIPTTTYTDGSQTISWEEGIPAGEKKLWATTCTFFGSGGKTGWSTPRQMTDTATYDVEFSIVEENQGNPTDNPDQWFDPDTRKYRDWSAQYNHTYNGNFTNVIWRAEKWCKNGEWDADWTILRVKGEKGDSIEGEEGRGIVSIDTYYMRSTEYSGVVASTASDPTTDGWSASRIEPTEEEPYLWRFTRITYTKGTPFENSDAELIYVWQDLVNTNLLADTEFVSGQMSMWVEQGVYETEYTPSTSNIGIATSSSNQYQGHNSYRSQFRSNANESSNVVITLLSQVLYDDSGVRLIEKGKWYTLSFMCRTNPVNTNLDVSIRGIIDTTASRFVDGVEQVAANVSTDFHYVQFKNTQNYTWQKHTFTFKAAQTLSNENGAPLRLKFYTTGVTSEQRNVYLSIPKLEIGKVDTAYKSKTSVIEPMARTSTWAEGKQYYQGAIGEPFFDIVSKDNRWHRCLRSHISNDSNKPIDGFNVWWERTDNLSFVATDLLLADQAVINLLFSQKILMTNSSNVLTASINADGNGSYCIYYPSGNKRMEFLYEGFIRYYNDDDGSLAWQLGHGGDITKGSSDDWALFPLHKLTNDEMDGLNENSEFAMTNYWQFHSGSGGQYSSQDGNIYTSKPSNRNPVTATLIGNGQYTPNINPFQEIVGDTAVSAITVYTISGGKITDTRTLIENIDS